MYFSVCVHLYLGLGKNCLVARRDFLSSKTVYCEDIMGITHFKTKLHVHSRPRICTPFTRITRVLREYYVRKANYAHLRVTCAHLRVTYLINIHKQR